MPYIAIAYSLVFLRVVVRPIGALPRWIYLAVLMSLFVFSAFRFEVGCDWSGYLNQYVVVGSRGWADLATSRDFLWWAMLKGVVNLQIAYPWINVISSAVFFVGLHALGRRQPDPLAFVVVLFPILIVNMPMSGIRQAAAIGFFCLALCGFLDGRLLRYAFWVAMAAAVHSSAAVFLFLAPFATGVYNRDRYLLTILLAIPGLYLLGTGSSAEVAIRRYLDNGNEALGAVFRLTFLALSGLAFFVILRKPWRRLCPSDYPLAAIGALMMAGLILLLPLSTVVSDRLGYYLLPIQAMIFARVPYLFRGTNRALLSPLPYIGLLVLFTVWTQTSRHFSQCYMPYGTWLTGLPGATS